VQHLLGSSIQAGFGETAAPACGLGVVGTNFGFDFEAAGARERTSSAETLLVEPITTEEQQQ